MYRTFFNLLKQNSMTVRRTTGGLRKYLRFGGLLLVFILFIPILGIYFSQTFKYFFGNRLSLFARKDMMTSVNTMAPSVMMAPVPENVNVDRSVQMPMMDKQTFDGASMMNEQGSFTSSMPMISGGVVSVPDRRVVMTAALTLRTKSLDWTVGKVEEIVKNVGGFVENSNVSQPNRGIRSAWVTVKVPVDRFDVTRKEVKEAADQVMSENMGTSDVTSQSIDLDAQISNKRAEEKSYENLLGTATKVSDVIEITQRLTQVRTEIESLEQTKRYLDGQTEWSSLSLSITEDPQVQVQSGELRRGNVFKQSVTDLTHFVVAFVSGLVTLVVSVLPVVLVYGVVIWAAYRFGRFIARRLVSKKK